MAYCTIIPRIKLGNPQIGLISEPRFVSSNTSSLAAINHPKKWTVPGTWSQVHPLTQQFFGATPTKDSGTTTTKEPHFWDILSFLYHLTWIIALMSSDFLGKCCRCLPLDACLHHEHREIEQHEGSFAEGCHFDHIPLIFELFRMYLCFYSCSTPPKKALESSTFKACRYLLMFLTSISSQDHESLPNTINICRSPCKGCQQKGPWSVCSSLAWVAMWYCPSTGTKMDSQNVLPEYFQSSTLLPQKHTVQSWFHVVIPYGCFQK